MSLTFGLGSLSGQRLSRAVSWQLTAIEMRPWKLGKPGYTMSRIGCASPQSGISPSPDVESHSAFIVRTALGLWLRRRGMRRIISVLLVLAGLTALAPSAAAGQFKKPVYYKLNAQPY